MRERFTIRVGTTNKVKLAATEEVLKEYPAFIDVICIGVRVDSAVSAQPFSLDETIDGAMNRARGAYESGPALYGIGIESGLVEVPHSKSGYMDVCVVAIFDGREFSLGTSGMWEFPDKRVIALMRAEGLNMSEAINRMGYTTNPFIGEAEGAIGIVTHGRVNRKEYTKQALRMAFIHLDASV